MHNPAIIGFSIWCQSFPIAVLLSRQLKLLDPEVQVLFGGPQASILDKEILESFTDIDMILRGEAEESLPALMSHLLSGKNEGLTSIKGLTFRKSQCNGEIHQHPDTGYIKDLNQLPIPQYEENIQYDNIRLDVGRGCPYQCTYCTTNEFFSRSYRVKSGERILREIKHCTQNLQTKRFGFVHDTLTVDKKFMHMLCDRITRDNRDKNGNYTWTCSSRTDCLTETMLDEMWASGCRGLFLGIESGSEKIQKAIKKNLDLENAGKMVKHAVRLGMHVTVSYMLGFPEETEEDVNLTLKSIIDMSILGAKPQMSLLSVMPGTPLFNRYADDLRYDGKTFGYSGTSLTPPVAELVQTDHRLFSSFYYLPNKELKREDLVFLCNLVNFLPHFIPTIQSLEDLLGNDLQNISLFSYISKTSKKILQKEKLVFPELIYLTDQIKQCLESLIYMGLHPYILDLFIADCTKAFMQVNYHERQYSKVLIGRYDTKTKGFKMVDRLKIIPVWKMIKTTCNIHHRANCYFGRPHPVRIKKGNYRYLVLPVSDEYCKLLRIERRLIPILENLTDMNVGEFIQICSPDLNEHESFNLLKKLAKLRMIEISPVM